MHNMKRNVFAKRRIMKNVDVVSSKEFKCWCALYEEYYPRDGIPTAFIYDVAWSEIANKKLNEIKEPSSA